DWASLGATSSAACGSSPSTSCGTTRPAGGESAWKSGAPTENGGSFPRLRTRRGERPSTLAPIISDGARVFETIAHPHASDAGTVEERPGLRSTECYEQHIQANLPRFPPRTYCH